VTGLPALLAIVIPAGLALLAAVGWALGRRPRPPSPPAVEVPQAARMQALERVRDAEAAHAEAVADIVASAKDSTEERVDADRAEWRGRRR
jgi:hypothetical protein